MSRANNFMYNSMLASALSQLLPAEERRVIRSWIDKLYGVTDGMQMPIRDDYMWFLLLNLQNKRVTIPFNALPKPGDLVPLKNILPNNIYNETLNSRSDAANLAWIDQVMTRGGGGGSDGSRQRFEPQRGGTNIAPSQFLRQQPRPQRGILCYMGAFSDQHKL